MALILLVLILAILLGGPGVPGCLRFGLVAPGAHALLWSFAHTARTPEHGVPY